MRIDDLINGKKVSRLQVITLLLCFLVVAVDGFDVAAAGYVAPLLKREWALGVHQLGLVFGAGLFGLTVGSFVLGPLADKIGRKRTIMVAMVLFGIGSLLTAAAPSIGWLIALRFLTGVGLGGGMPCAITLSSEYSPERHRPMLVTLMFCGFTLGLAFGGQLAALIMPTFGWRGVFMAGGIAPLLLLPVIGYWLPESVRFMAGKKKFENETRTLLVRLTGDAALDVHQFLRRQPEEPLISAQPSATLFNAHYRAGTMLLWLAFFCTLWVYYQISSWLPSVLAESGMTVAQSAQVGSILPISGTIGAIINAVLMRRMNPYLVLTGSYILAAISIVCIGSAMTSPGLLALAVCCAGLGLSGAQTGANVLVAGFYTTNARATGVSWALGVGRIGSIFGSITGGMLLAMLETPGKAFFVFALPALIAAAAMFVMGRVYCTKAVGVTA